MVPCRVLAASGGMLAMTRNPFVSPAHYYYNADGNGNVIALADANQLIVARYIYDPFGNMVSKSGPLADVNTYRFSSKDYHVNSGLVYYEYRFYEPNLQRWLTRVTHLENEVESISHASLGIARSNAIDPRGLQSRRCINGSIDMLISYLIGDAEDGGLSQCPSR